MQEGRLKNNYKILVVDDDSTVRKSLSKVLQRFNYTVITAQTKSEAESMIASQLKVNLAIISTIYPGASSEVVSRDITKPIEGAIKSISGIETYTSVSRNSSSTVSVTIESNADADSVVHPAAPQRESHVCADAARLLRYAPAIPSLQY